MGNGKNKSRKSMTTRTCRNRQTLASTMRKSKRTEVAATYPPDYDPNTVRITPNSIENLRIIVDMDCIQQVIHQATEHARDCNGHYEAVAKTWKMLKLTCSLCSNVVTINKDSDNHELPINDAFVVGAYCSGVGYSGLKSILNCLECSFICKKTYTKAESKVGVKLQNLVEVDLDQNLVEAKKYAEENGEVIEIQNVQYPFTSVIVDGGWAKRSYGHSYSANAGVGVIISEPLKKILHMGYRIKTCKVCDSNIEKDHVCFKNWDESAQAMEADIIAKGFQECFNKHGIIFKNLIGDADSAVHARVLSTVNYPGRLPVTKVDCANHGVRGLNSRIYGIVKNNSYNKTERDAIQKQLNRFGKDVRAAISYNNENMRSPIPTTAVTLAEDIVNIPRHIFGSHEKCKAYFCKGGGENMYEGLVSSPAFQDLMKGFHLIANRAYKLIADTTSNRAELFMSIMNKLVSGKRVNYAQRGGYANRCCAAVLSYNHGRFWPGKMLVKNQELGPCSVWKQALKEMKVESKAQAKKPKKIWGHALRRGIKKNEGKDFYGEQATQGTLTDLELQLANSNLISSLQVTPESRNKIQLDTVGQCYNDEWKYQRRNRITASNCGRIYRMKDSTNNSSTLKSLLYPVDLSRNENIVRGINMEPRAKEVYSIKYGVDVAECGLFVSSENGILAASPDGLIGDDGLLEVKSVNCRPEDVPLRKSSFLRFTDKKRTVMELKQTHLYFFQVVMQLYVCDRNYCDFMVYYESPEDSSTCEYFIQRISKSQATDELWVKMKDKLIKFYEFDVASEISDPTLPKGLPFRQPTYRVEAINRRLQLKSSKDAKKSD